MAGLKSGVRDLGVSVSEIKESELVPILQKLGGMDTIDPATVAEFVVNIQAGKFREQVPEYLARSLWVGAKSCFDRRDNSLGQRPTSKRGERGALKAVDAGTVSPCLRQADEARRR
jgi:hypothetical protein